MQYAKETSYCLNYKSLTKSHIKYRPKLYKTYNFGIVAHHENKLFSGIKR